MVPGLIGQGIMFKRLILMRLLHQDGMQALVLPRLETIQISFLVVTMVGDIQSVI